MDTTAKALVRAGCYLRISSDPDDKREGTARQREDTAALCEVQGWTVAGVYPDDNRSASNGKDRPEWKRLLADITAGKIDAIAAWDQDRNWRMMSELEDLRKFFTSLGREVKLATTGQGEIDLYSPTGVLMAQIKTAVSEHEIAMMRVRQKRAARQRAEQGRPKWKRAFGYVPDTRPKERDDGTRKIDRKVQPRVRAAYRAVVATNPDKRKTITAIAQEWNAAGLRGLNGQPWSPSTLSLFLRSPRNAGLRDHNGEIVLDADGQPVRGTWPPLVDEDLWRTAQTVLNAPHRLRPKKVKLHALTGVMRCGRVDGKKRCAGTLGGQYVRQAGNQEAERAYALAYTCKVCRRVTIRDEHVRPLLMTLLVERLSAPEAVELLRGKTVDPAQAEKLRTEEAVLRARLLENSDMRDDGEMTREQFVRSNARIQEKLDAIAARQQDQERKRVLDGLPLGKREVADKIEKLSPDRLRAVFDLLATITVKPVGKGGHVFDPDRVDLVWKD
jgi:DNA invertase Pin-like site-specific DNA recombinase